MIDLLVRDELIAAPHSSLNVPIGATRRIATVHVGLQELKEIRAALGGKVNDVLLCAATGGLRGCCSPAARTRRARACARWCR